MRLADRVHFIGHLNGVVVSDRVKARLKLSIRLSIRITVRDRDRDRDRVRGGQAEDKGYSSKFGDRKHWLIVHAA